MHHEPKNLGQERICQREIFFSSVCLCVFLHVCVRVNEIPTLIFYMCMLSDVSTHQQRTNVVINAIDAINSLPAKSCYSGEKKSDSYFQVGTYRVAGTINQCVEHLKSQPNHPKSQK